MCGNAAPTCGIESGVIEWSVDSGGGVGCGRSGRKVGSFGASMEDIRYWQAWVDCLVLKMGGSCYR